MVFEIVISFFVAVSFLILVRYYWSLYQENKDRKRWIKEHREDG